jgi:Ca2+-binding EF-hand superfamily protein
MLGKLQEHKITHYFNVYDKDRDGFITKEEFLRLAYLLAEYRGRDMSDPRSQRTLTDLENWWHGLSAVADTSRDDRLSLEEWLAFWTAISDAVGDEAMNGGSTALGMIKDSVKVFVSAVDTDGDQRVTLTEFQQWANGMRLPGDTAAIFARLDTNSDGYLSLDEATQMMKEFFLTNDPEAPGNHFFGIIY